MKNSTAPAPAINLYLIEFYTKHPKTGEGGWDIKFAWVGAASRQEARAKMGTRPTGSNGQPTRFDEVITCEEQSYISPLSGCTGADIFFIDVPPHRISREALDAFNEPARIARLRSFQAQREAADKGRLPGEAAIHNADRRG